MLKSDNYDQFISFVRKQFSTESFIPLHVPILSAHEREKVLDALESTFVSTVGKYVGKIEEQLCEFTGSRFVIATNCGTSALHVALRLAGVERDTEVITQPLTFVATANAIAYQHAQPVFVDVCSNTLGMSPESLTEFLELYATTGGGKCLNRKTGRTIAACVPMHTFGFPVDIQAIVSVCEKYGIPVVEDAAESLGSKVGDRHTGTFGRLGTLSFNGNKVVTAGGGGAVLTDDPELAALARHLTTTAKLPHRWEYVHDHVAYNYRMPNLNAALLSAQLDRLPELLANKRILAERYAIWCRQHGMNLVAERAGTTANYWLMTLLLPDLESRNEFLQYTNDNGVMTRPAWALLNTLNMYRDCLCMPLPNAEALANRIVNIPSSACVRLEKVSS